jgi:hypothetical protein
MIQMDRRLVGLRAEGDGKTFLGPGIYPRFSSCRSDIPSSTM